MIKYEIMKCRCINKNIWYKIDDSLELNQNGGQYTFEIGQEYDYIIEDNKFFGITYLVNNNNNLFGFDTIKFFLNFELNNK